jgi:hypothetical protein
MDEADGVDVFWVLGPPWVVVHEGKVAEDDSGLPLLLDGGKPVTIKGERNRGIVLFTDRDLADRCIAELRRQGQRPATFKSVEHFAAFLQRIQSRGETHVGFDPGKQVRFFSIERVLDAIPKRGA